MGPRIPKPAFEGRFTVPLDKTRLAGGPSVRSVFSCAAKEHAMFDIVLLALGLAFFVLSVAYAYACDRL